MTAARYEPERGTETVTKDLTLVLQALQEAFSVVDDHDPDRNPARCMRQLRRLLDNVSLRIAARRLAADLPETPPRSQ